MDKLDRIILGIGISCAVIGLQLGLHNSDIRELKNEVKELRSENEAFKFCFKKLGFVIGFEESESGEVNSTSATASWPLASTYT